MLSKNKARKLLNRTRGFSLVTVVVTASLTSIFLLASAAAILPIYKTIGTSVTDIQLLSAAQSATDLTIGLLNDQNSSSTFDCPHVYGASSKVNLLYPLTASRFGLPEGATVEVWVRNVAPMPTAVGSSANSLAFDPILSPSSDPNLPAELAGAKEQWSLYSGAGKNGWRVIEARVKFGTAQKLLFTTLKPVLIANDVNTASTLPLFSDASLVSNGRGLKKVMLGAGTVTSAVPSFSGADYKIGGQTVAGDIASFGEVSLNGNAKIGGRAQIQKDTSGNLKGTVTSDGTGEINQYLQSDGVYSNIDSSSVHNYGDINNPDPNFKNYPGDARDDAPSLTSTGVAPAPSAPDGVVPSTSLTEASPKLNGDYVVPSINVQNGSLETSGPSRIFIEGSNGLSSEAGSSNNVVSIQGKLNPGNEASNLQIYYGGTGTLVLQGTEINATIYAPNANVQMGSGTTLNFTGSVLARNIAGSYLNGVPNSGVANTNIRLDYGNRNKTGSSTNAGLSYEESDVTLPKRFKVVSVLEPRNPNDPKYAH